MSLLTHTQFDTSRVIVTTSVSQYKPLLDFVVATHGQVMFARYLAVSGIALLVYDWLTNLDKEIEYAWSRKWTLARVVYHLNRVLSILFIGAVLIPNILFAPAHFAPLRCKNVVLSYGYGVIAMVTIVCITSIIRCWALYGQRWVLCVLAPGLAMTAAHSTFRLTRIIRKATIMPNTLPELFQGCLISIPNDMWLAYISGVFFELVVFCMIMWRIWYLGRGLGLTPLMEQLLKDGASFFAINLALILFSCVGSAYPSTIIVANGSGVLTALSSVMCSRIFFSIHDFGRGDQVRVTPGLPLTTGAHCDATISVQFAVPMETFSNSS
ncbi:hypothetical protein B0J17DRAFT_708540 [Rhizoctonia solani]|nr:hypothetical protein B0J17DRAFT_708540 [Rhizoctonia solani]